MPSFGRLPGAVSSTAPLSFVTARSVEPTASRSVSLGAAPEEPRDACEEAVAKIWSDVLNVERVGIHDDFFELGGHSLLATQVVARIRSRFEAQLPLRVIFESPTVAGVAAALTALIDAETADEDMSAMLDELEHLVDGMIEIAAGESGESDATASFATEPAPPADHAPTDQAPAAETPAPAEASHADQVPTVSGVCLFVKRLETCPCVMQAGSCQSTIG